MSEVASERHPARGGLLLAATMASVALPFLSVDFPPVTDLPQHAVQVRLLGEALADPSGPYRVQWATPYSLSYALVALGWALGGPLASGRLAMLATGLLWAAALAWLARRHARPAGAAAVAAVFFFSRPTYWGLYSFVLGFPAFALFLEAGLARRPGEEGGLRGGTKLLGAGTLLYFCHALWFAAGLGWLLVRSVLAGPSLRQGLRPALSSAFRQTAPLLPVVAGAAVWLRFYALAGGGTAPRWDLAARLTPSFYADALLGGLRGALEPVALALVLAWVGAGLWQARRVPGLGVEKGLALPGVLLLLVAAAGPDVAFGTLNFGSRWGPPAAALLVLASPAPRIRPSLAALAAAAGLVAFCSVTARTWQAFEEEELSGLPEALSRLPGRPAVLGLDLLGVSPRVKGRPYLNLHAYAQLLRGGTLNFSCAQIPTSLVVFRPGVADRFAWSQELEWKAFEVTPADVLHFDFAVVGAQERYHPNVPRALPLAPVTGGGAWRLYRVVRPTARATGGAGG